MEANRSRTRWTYAQFARLPGEGGTRHEVIDGALAVTPAPTSEHQQAVTDLVMALGPFVRAHGLGRLLAGPIDVLLGEGDYLEPDLVFVRADRAHIVSPRGVEGPPDLVVEVLSPSTAKRDRGVKLERYRHFQVPEYWIVDAGARSVDIWRFARGAEAAEVVAGPDGRLAWTPVPGAPTLDVALAELLPEAL